MRLSIAFCGATALTALNWMGLTTPNLLLVLCFVIGCGMALMGPAWQSSVSEQVPLDGLPAAVALNGISYNIARSFGSAIGGVVAATAGAGAAFALNAVLYLPLMSALFLCAKPSRLPREQLSRAIISGMRYITNSSSIKIVLARATVIGVIGSSISALIPLVARDLLHGGAQTNGIILGAFGHGADIGALNVGEVPQAHERRSCCLRVLVRLGRRDRGRSAEQRASSDRNRTRPGRRRVDDHVHAVHYRRAALRASLGRGRSLAAYQAAFSGGVAVGGWGWVASLMPLASR
ncbi:putative MFS family arabinose efflux permease [Bradyrhizobium sp. USDA 4509]